MVIYKQEKQKGEFGKRRYSQIDTVVLHHTAGASHRSSKKWIDYLNTTKYKKLGIAVHYYIGRGGAIYNTVPLDRYGYHTGVGLPLDKRSICIELANFGNLAAEEKDGKIIYKNVYNQEFKDIYNSKDAEIKEEYLVYNYSEEQGDGLWRFFYAFERYRKEQIKSLLYLLNFIGKECYNIDLSKCSYLCPKKADTKPEEAIGIISHSNLRDAYQRKDGTFTGKWDLSPAILEHFEDGKIYIEQIEGCTTG